jgi:hypothetical protein
MILLNNISGAESERQGTLLVSTFHLILNLFFVYLNPSQDQSNAQAESSSS